MTRVTYIANQVMSYNVLQIDHHSSLCGGHTERPRDLRVIYEQTVVKMACHQELVGKILSSSYVTCQKVVTFSWTLAITQRTRIARHKFPDRMERFKTVGKLFLSDQLGAGSYVGCQSLTNWSYVTRGLICHSARTKVRRKSLLKFLQSGNFCRVTYMWEGSSMTTQSKKYRILQLISRS